MRIKGIGGGKLGGLSMRLVRCCRFIAWHLHLHSMGLLPKLPAPWLPLIVALIPFRTIVVSDPSEIK